MRKASLERLSVYAEREECVISKGLIVVCFAVVLLGIALFIGWKLGFLTFYFFRAK